MMLKTTSIYDAKTEAWQDPMFFQALGQAMRSFGDAVNNEKSQFFAHPEDYTMFYIGDWDGDEGMLHPLPAPEVVATAITMKEMVER